MRPYRLDSTRLELRQHLSNVHIKFCDKGCAGKSGREATRYAQEALAMARSLQAAALKSDLKSDSFERATRCKTSSMRPRRCTTWQSASGASDL